MEHAGGVSGENVSQVQPSLPRPEVLNGTIREAFLSAVHQEMRKKESRRSNIVVSGVYPAGDGDCDVDDATVISDIIFFHFDIRPAITRTRRIRRETPGRAQLLLVTFADQAAAAYLIDNAKLLRESLDADIRRFVVFNRDLTKAESQAAYEQRVRRRLNKKSGTRIFSSTTRISSRDRQTTNVISPQGRTSYKPPTLRIGTSVQPHVTVKNFQPAGYGVLERSVNQTE